MKQRRTKKLMKPKKGFSLPELLIAIVVFLIVGLITLNLLSDFISFFVSDDEQVLARQRGMDVIKVLEVPILHSALGIPANIPGDTYRQDVFQRTFPAATNAPFRNWGSPLSISGSKNDDLRILYGKASGVFQLDENKDAFSINPLEETLRLSEPLSALNVSLDAPGRTNGWITFPGQMLPVTIKSGLGTDEPVVQAYRESIQTAKYSEKINAFNEVIYLQARRAWVDNDNVFHLMEVISSDAQGTGPDLTLPGVMRIRFARVENNHILSMDVLTRGDSRDPGRIQKLKNTRPDLVSRWSITDDEAEFVLEETSMQWRIRNYETQ